MPASACRIGETDMAASARRCGPDAVTSAGTAPARNEALTFNPPQVKRPSRARTLRHAGVVAALLVLNLAGVVPWARWIGGVCAPLAPVWSSSAADTSTHPCELRPAPPSTAQGLVLAAVVLPVSVGVACARIRSWTAHATDERRPPSYTVRPLVPPPVSLP